MARYLKNIQFQENKVQICLMIKKMNKKTNFQKKKNFGIFNKEF